MIKLKMEIFEDKAFYEAFARLIKKELAPDNAVKLERIARSFEHEKKNYINEYVSLLTKYAELDEQGSPVMQFEEKDGSKVPVGHKLRDKEGFSRAKAELKDKDLVLELEPLTIEDLKGSTVSAQDLIILEKLITPQK